MSPEFAVPLGSVVLWLLHGMVTASSQPEIPSSALVGSRESTPLSKFISSASRTCQAPPLIPYSKPRGTGPLGGPRPTSCDRGWISGKKPGNQGGFVGLSCRGCLGGGSAHEMLFLVPCQGSPPCTRTSLPWLERCAGLGSCGRGSRGPWSA